MFIAFWICFIWFIQLSKVRNERSSLFSCVCQWLLAAWPPAELLSDLENWLKKMEARLNQDEETLLKAKDDAQVTEVLQRYKVQAHPLFTLSFVVYKWSLQLYSDLFIPVTHLENCYCSLVPALVLIGLCQKIYLDSDEKKCKQSFSDYTWWKTWVCRKWDESEYKPPSIAEVVYKNHI